MRVLAARAVLPNNWKLYVENVKDTYHASLLHASSALPHHASHPGGGIIVSPTASPRQLHHRSGRDRVSTAYRDQGIRSEHQNYRLADPSLLDSVDEYGDGIKLEILTCFPNSSCSRSRTGLAVRRSCQGPGLDGAALAYFGFTDDTPEMHRRRLKQLNLVAPPAMSRWRTAAWAASCSRGARPPRATSSPW